MRRVPWSALVISALAALWVGTASPAQAEHPVDYNVVAGIPNELINHGGSLSGTNDWSRKPSAEHPKPGVLAHSTGIGAQTKTSVRTFAHAERLPALWLAAVDGGVVAPSGGADEADVVCGLTPRLFRTSAHAGALNRSAQHWILTMNRGCEQAVPVDAPAYRGESAGGVHILVAGARCGVSGLCRSLRRGG